MLLIDIPVVVSHIQSGAFKALGVASEQRSSSLPDVPTVIEAGIPGVIAEGWYAMYAPAGTSPVIVSALQGAIGDVLAQAPIVQAIAGVGGIVQTSSAESLTAYQRAEFDKWGEAVVREVTNRFRLDPGQSYVSKETRATDPEFWSPK